LPSDLSSILSTRICTTGDSLTHLGDFVILGRVHTFTGCWDGDYSNYEYAACWCDTPGSGELCGCGQIVFCKKCNAVQAERLGPYKNAVYSADNQKQLVRLE